MIIITKCKCAHHPECVFVHAGHWRSGMDPGGLLQRARATAAGLGDVCLLHCIRPVLRLPGAPHHRPGWARQHWLELLGKLWISEPLGLSVSRLYLCGSPDMLNQLTWKIHCCLFVSLNSHLSLPVVLCDTCTNTQSITTNIRRDPLRRGCLIMLPWQQLLGMKGSRQQNWQNKEELPHELNCNCVVFQYKQEN